MLAVSSGSVPWWGAVVAVVVGAALTQIAHMLNARGERQADLRRWHRERIEQAFVAFIQAGESCRQAQVDLMHGRGGSEGLEETMRGLVSARPLLRITATDLSLVAVQEYVDAIAHVNELLTDGGTKDKVDAAFQEAATTLCMVEIMARREAGLKDIVYEGPNNASRPSSS